ncbi:prolyl oligopeptidase family serine peptidase [Streptosporangium sp. NPDC002607]
MPQKKIISGIALMCIGLSACSAGSEGANGAGTGSAAPVTRTTDSCPTSALGMPPGQGPGGTPSQPASPPANPPGGNAGGGSQRPAITFATTIKPSDTSTSTVIKADGPQMRCDSTEITTAKDIVYAKSDGNGQPVELKMDVLTPATEGERPLVVYLSGGGFVMSTKEAALDQRTYIAQQGYTVASIQYRTVTTGGTYTEGVSDVKSAIRYLRAHADTYGIDPTKVAVWGESAGGYLAAMAGATNGVKTFERGDNLDQSSDVQAVIDKFGAADLTKIGDDYDQAAKEAGLTPGHALAQYVFGPGTTKSILDDPKVTAAADPASYLDGAEPAFLLLHGSADRLVSPSQTLRLHQALRAKGADSTRLILQDADHGDLAFTGNPTAGKPWTSQEVMDALAGFLDKQLKG